jgi:hypothetical protein
MTHTSMWRCLPKSSAAKPHDDVYLGHGFVVGDNPMSFKQGMGAGRGGAERMTGKRCPSDPYLAWREMPQRLCHCRGSEWAKEGDLPDAGDQSEQRGGVGAMSGGEKRRKNRGEDKGEKVERKRKNEKEK